MSLNTDGFEAVDFYRLFLTDGLLSVFVEETNRYAQQLLQQPLQPQSRLYKWENTNAEEMKVFCGLVFLMAINRKPEIALYWSQDSLLLMPVFPVAMSKDRFQILLSCWHFADKLQIVTVKIIVDFSRQNHSSKVCQEHLNQYTLRISTFHWMTNWSSGKAD